MRRELRREGNVTTGTVFEPGSERAAPTPAVSLVVVSVSLPAQLESCLSSLRDESGRWSVEVIVVRSGAPGEVAGVVGQYPFARVVFLEPGTSIPQLRAAGMRVVTGNVVAFTEDRYDAPAGWLEQLVNGGARPESFLAEANRT